MGRKTQRDDPFAPLFSQLGQQEFASIEAMQAWLDQQMAAWNTAGQHDLGGLSPDQMHRLLQTDWRPDSVTCLSRDLSLDDVAGSAWYHGARALLVAVDVRGGIQETATGTLPDPVSVHLVRRFP